MAWNWSHTEEAYIDARENLRKLPRDELLMIRREWIAYVLDANDADNEGFSISKYEEAVAKRTFEDQTTEELADYIWDRASDVQICDNGGWNAWVCPYGCHTVPFSPVA